MIRVGLAGFGMGGRVFHAPLISSVEGLELAAIVERSTNEAAARYPQIATHRSVEAMLADDSLSLIVVTTPNATHFDVARQALSAGRHVVVDKPVAVTATEIAQMMELAAAQKKLLIPFHNRRWDSDFLTIQKLLHEGSLGQLVHFESHFDRWRPNLPTTRLWKESPALGGGTLLDLGTHIADQALTLFGNPEVVWADVRRERDGGDAKLGANDAIVVRLRYAGGLVATLIANSLTLPSDLRFHLRGTKGNYWKRGMDPQEAKLTQISRIDDPHWGEEPAAAWGTLHVDADGNTVSRPVAPFPGDYRLFYAGVRDAVLGHAAAPVAAIDAWRVATILEAAVFSSAERCEVLLDWSSEPKA